MKRLLLKLKENELTPGSQVIGGVIWELPKAPKSLEVRLFWSTIGYGDKDLHIVESKSFAPATQGKEKFAFTLPEGPYSFSGKLITLAWGIDFIGDKGKKLATEEIVFSPNRLEIQL